MDAPDLPSHYQPDPTTMHLLLAFFAGLLTGMLMFSGKRSKRNWIFGNIIIAWDNGRVGEHFEG